jgi:hypothetical protein
MNQLRTLKIVTKNSENMGWSRERIKAVGGREDTL